MKGFWIALIRFYQRFISPYKGFRCAHAAVYAGPSCSAAVRAIIAEHGLIAGLPQIRARFQACSAAYASIQHEGDRRYRRNKQQERGRCVDKGECVCDACELFYDLPKGCKSVDLNPCDFGIGPCDCSL